MAKWMGLVAVAAILVSAGQAGAATFDARKPADIAAALKAEGVTGEMKVDEQGRAYFDGHREGLNFSVEFRDCDSDTGLCGATYFMASWTMEAPPASTLNLWNDVTWFCVAFKSTGGEPFLKMPFAPKATDTRAGLIEDYGHWLTCTGAFVDLLENPAAFEASIK